MQDLELRTLNPDRNFLAYLRNQCYGLRKLNYVFDFDMSVFGKLRQGFAGAAALATATFAASPAFAQDASESTKVAMLGNEVADTIATSNSAGLSMYEDADFEAARWVVDHPRRLAIAISLGQGTEVPTERIESILLSDFASFGVTNVTHEIRFFYERGGTNGSAASFQTDSYGTDIIPLSRIRDHVEDMAGRIGFNQQLASNIN